MRILGMDGFRVFVEIDREEYPRLVKILANMDTDNPEEN